MAAPSYRVTGIIPNTEVRGKQVFLSVHAVEAMVARDIGPDRVIQALMRYENRYVQSRKRSGAGTEPYMYQHQDIGVAVAERDKLIIVKTVVFRDNTDWQSKDRRYT